MNMSGPRLAKGSLALQSQIGGDRSGAEQITTVTGVPEKPGNLEPLRPMKGAEGCAHWALDDLTRHIEPNRRSGNSPVSPRWSNNETRLPKTPWERQMWGR